MRRGSTEVRLSRLGVISAGVLLLLGAILAARNEFDFRRDAVGQVTAQADVLASSTTAALAFQDRRSLEQYVRALRANGDIGSAAIYDASGVRLAQFAEPGEPQPPARAPPALARWTGARATAVRVAQEQGQTLGFVFLQSRRDTTLALFARHSGVALLTVMALLLVVLVSTAGSTLQRRARQLADANALLQDEMSARAAAEEALRQSQKMEALGQLTGGIAHDFNNLLQVIIGTLDMLRRARSDPRREQKLLSAAMVAAERGSALTRQLLAFSRTQRLELKVFRVGLAIQGMQDMLRRTLGASIELVLELEDGALPVRSDPNQLELAVLNLAINARDAMPEGGQLKLATSIVELRDDEEPSLAAGRYVVLRVSDTGKGMPAETARRAFEPFFTTKMIGKGTGLGLSQVYGLARQSGGLARIESAEGKGTTVIVYLRGAEAAAEHRKHEAAVSDTPVFAAKPGTRVLIVDDDEPVRALLRETLVLLGYETSEAADGDQALDILRDRCPDVLIVDFAMPGMNGAQVADAARAICPQLPILFASGHSDTDAIRRAAGEDAVILQKPYRMEILAQAVLDATGASGRKARSPP